MKTPPSISHKVLQDPYTKDYHITINIVVKETENNLVLNTSLKQNSTQPKINDFPTAYNHSFSKPYDPEDFLADPHAYNWSPPSWGIPSLAEDRPHKDSSLLTSLASLSSLCFLSTQSLKSLQPTGVSNQFESINLQNLI